MNRKILVTGASGQIGSEIIKLYKNTSHIIRGVSSSDLNITNEKSVNIYMDDFKPDIIIHCAAYTSVDKAEIESDICYDVNALGTKYLIKASKNYNVKFLYLSSDYVFDGKLERPYDVDYETKPINIYGKSKLEGELVVKEYSKKHFIVRTSWIFGNGRNFVNSMIKLAQSNSQIKVVNDQIGSPTYSFDLAKLITIMVETDKYGTYHATNEEYCSWYDFACEIFKIKDIKVDVIPILSEEYSSLAKRPKNSRLSKRSLIENGFKLFPTWKDSLNLFLEN